MSSISSCLHGHRMLYIARDPKVLGALLFGTRFALYFNPDQPLYYSETKLHHLQTRTQHPETSPELFHWLDYLVYTMSTSGGTSTKRGATNSTPKTSPKRQKAGAARITQSGCWSKEQVVRLNPRSSPRESLGSPRMTLLYKGLSNMCTRMRWISSKK